jgi:hypothetical protein
MYHPPARRDMGVIWFITKTTHFLNNFFSESPNLNIFFKHVGASGPDIFSYQPTLSRDYFYFKSRKTETSQKKIFEIFFLKVQT